MQCWDILWIDKEHRKMSISPSFNSCSKDNDPGLSFSEMCGWILSSRPSFCSEASGFNVLNCAEMVAATSSYSWVTARKPSSCWPCLNWMMISFRLLLLGSQFLPLLSGAFLQNITRSRRYGSSNPIRKLPHWGWEAKVGKCRWSEVSNILHSWSQN